MTIFLLALCYGVFIYYLDIRVNVRARLPFVQAQGPRESRSARRGHAPHEAATVGVARRGVFGNGAGRHVVGVTVHVAYEPREGRDSVRHRDRCRGGRARDHRRVDAIQPVDE